MPIPPKNSGTIYHSIVFFCTTVYSASEMTNLREELICWPVRQPDGLLVYWPAVDFKRNPPANCYVDRDRRQPVMDSMEGCISFEERRMPSLVQSFKASLRKPVRYRPDA